MPRPYSNDQRNKIVDTVEKGSSCRRAAELFDVSVNLVIKLMQRFLATGDISPGQFGGFKSLPLLAYESDVRSLIAATPELTIGEICTRFAEPEVKTGGLSCRVQRPADRANRISISLPRPLQKAWIGVG